MVTQCFVLSGVFAEVTFLASRSSDGDEMKRFGPCPVGLAVNMVSASGCVLQRFPPVVSSSPPRV